MTVPIDPGDREQRVEVELWPVLPVAGTWTGLHGLLEVRDQCSWQIRRGGAWAGSCRMPMDDNFEFKGLGEGIYWIDVKGPKGVTTHRAELEVPAGGRTDLRLDFQPL